MLLKENEVGVVKEVVHQFLFEKKPTARIPSAKSKVQRGSRQTGEMVDYQNF